jgi:hypothetical protein
LGNGTVVVNYTLPFNANGVAADSNIMVDQDANIAYSWARISSPTQFDLIQIDLSNGNWQTIMTYSGEDITAGPTGYDPVHKIVVVSIIGTNNNPLLDATIIGFNVENGTILFKQSDYHQHNISGTLWFDSKTNLFYCHGVNVKFPGPQLAPTLVSLDPFTGETTEIKAYSQYYFDFAGLTAFDLVGRIFYTILSDPCMFLKS